MTTRACLLVALAMALALLLQEHAAGAEAHEQKQQVQRLLRRLNKPPVKTIEVRVAVKHKMLRALAITTGKLKKWNILCMYDDRCGNNNCQNKLVSILYISE